MLRSIYEDSILTRKVTLNPSLFIRPMHPKTEIRPTAEAIKRILGAGWVGQLKIHGHRAQIHIPAKEDEEILAYNRQGQLHKKELTSTMQGELRRLFTPHHGWNVIDAEWLKPEDKLFIFDFIKKDGKVLSALNFQERWKLLPRAYLSPSMQTLPFLTTLDQCMKAFSKSDPYLEGLVFKSPSPGFEDTSIIRCRKKS